MIKIILATTVFSHNVFWVCSIEKCNMNCINDGICRIGVPEFGYSSEITEDEDPDSFSHSEEKEYCGCPSGYTGAHCEIALKMCDNEDETCFNGDPCLAAEDDMGGSYYHCGCDVLKTEFSYAFSLHFCSNLHSIFCNGRNEGEKYFCSNDGKCNDSEGGDKCTCSEGWEGEHCQFPNSNAMVPSMGNSDDSPSNSHDSKSSGNISLFSVITILFVFSIIALTIVLSIRARRTRKEVPQRELEFNEFQMSRIDQSPYGCDLDADADTFSCMETPSLT